MWPGVERWYIFPSFEDYVDFLAKMLQAKLDYEFLRLRMHMDDVFHEAEASLRCRTHLSYSSGLTKRILSRMPA